MKNWKIAKSTQKKLQKIMQNVFDGGCATVCQNLKILQIFEFFKIFEQVFCVKKQDFNY